jgi:hypothetical protein
MLKRTNAKADVAATLVFINASVFHAVDYVREPDAFGLVRAIAQPQIGIIFDDISGPDMSRLQEPFLGC